MTYRKNVDKRLLRKEESYETEQLMKTKRSEEYQALEEVFDRSTLMTIYEFMNRGAIGEIHGVVKAGKEARIYWATNPQGKELAIKIYLTLSAEFKKGKLIYIIGDPRFKNVRHDTRSLVHAWALKEYKNLELATKAKVRVPKPYAVNNNVLIMEFIGKNGNTAPTMKEQPPKNPQQVYEKILEYIQRLYQKAQLVHGDISEYNTMIWRNKPILFDIAQAVRIEHPMANQFLLRDLNNLNYYFKRQGANIQPTQETYERITHD
ncbi:MAG TPA: serine protein kinase RIO [Candidatus Krumholzibacteriaceae bacterium]|nr:serine protein kinase RIO [Candidatus Krumholzibacteriaceae bacterium]